MTEMQKLYLLVPLAPLFGAIVAGLFGKIVAIRFFAGAADHRA